MSLASMADPEGYSARLGATVEAQVIDERDRLLGERRAGRTWRRSAQSYRARWQAEETVLAELVWAEPEPATGEGEDDELLVSYHRRLGLGEEILRGLADQAPGGRRPA